MAVTKTKPKKGGKQPGAGRPKGAISEKARTLLEVKNRIAKKADHLLNSEFLEALGSFVVMKANPAFPGQYTRVTDEDEIVQFIQENKGANGSVGDNVYIIAAKDGNYKSRQYLFDRAFGRPAQAVEVTNPNDAELKALREGIKSLAERMGTTYETELKTMLEMCPTSIKPDIREQLASELIN